MPRVRDGYRQLASQVPADVLAEFEALAGRNGRSIAEELAHAMRRHLAAPPTVRVVVEEPPLGPAEVEATARPAGRGRPRKAP